MGIDLKKFHESIQHDFEQQGRRVRAFVAETPSDAVKKTPDVVAAAIAGTCLQHLRAYAGHKFLSQADMDRALHAFMKGAGVRVTNDPMGAIVFKRTGA